MVNSLGGGIIAVFWSCFVWGQNNKVDYANFLYRQLAYQKASKVYQSLYAQNNLSQDELAQYLEALFHSHQYQTMANIAEEKGVLSYRQGLWVLKAYQKMEDNNAYIKTIQQLRVMYPEKKELGRYEKAIELLSDRRSKGYIVGDEVANLEEGATFPFYVDSTLTYFYPKEKTKVLSKHYSRNNVSYEINQEPRTFNMNKVIGPIWYNDSMLFVSNFHEKPNKGKLNLKIDFSYKEENYTLPFCSDTVSIAHPAYDAVNQRLYFVVKPTIGNSDIYYADYRNGKWESAQKLGETINTLGNEMFPYIHGDFLYFASDGLPGIGGMDLFEINIANLATGKPVNLGRKINSPFDDFGICFKDFSSGYFSSNRKAHKDAIYNFTYDTNAKINHCLNICQKTSCVTLSHEYSQNADIATKWVLGNGDTLLGHHIEYCYSQSGKYDCELFVYDTLNTAVLLFHEFFEVAIDDEVQQAPTIYINKEGKVGDTICFRMDSTHTSNIFGYEWHFGDGTTNRNQQVTHVYQEAGVYEVSCNTFYNDINGLSCCQSASVAYIHIKDTILIEGEQQRSSFSDDNYLVSIKLYSAQPSIHKQLELHLLNEQELTTKIFPIENYSSTIELEKVANYQLYIVNPISGDTIAFETIKHDGMLETDFKKERMILLDRSNNLFFKTNSFHLTETEEQKLRLMINYLNLHDKYRLRVEGYADALGGNMYNLELSKKRVEYVQNYLISKGVNEKRIIAKAYGEQTAENSLVTINNRRVELIIEKDE